MLPSALLAKERKASAPAAGKKKRENQIDAKQKKRKLANASVPAGEPKNTILKASISDVHTSETTLKEYAGKFRSGQPFPHLHIKNVFPDDLLQAVRTEVLSSTFFRKRNDLYDFAQTDSLRLADGNATAELRDYLYSDAFRSWIEKITGIKTTPQLDISAAQYNAGSYLLCHDDDLGTRRIAFIIYLVPETWEESDGGSLDLFSTDEQTMQPTVATSTLTPVWNSIAFFEVSPVSFHQVAEVLDDTKGPRLSISGWFHGEPVKDRPAPPNPPFPVFVGPEYFSGDSPDGNTENASDALVSFTWPLSTGADDSIESWINPMYLSAKVIPQIIEALTNDGNIELSNFLRPEKYEQVMKAMGSQNWKLVGPPILQSYKVALSTHEMSGVDITSSRKVSPCPKQNYLTGNGIVPDMAMRLYQFFLGHAFQEYVSTLSHAFFLGDDNDDSEEDVTGVFESASAQLRCFAHGDYTMVCDMDYKAQEKNKKSEDKGIKLENSAKKNKKSVLDDIATPSYVGSLLDVNFCCVATEEGWEDNDNAAGGYISYLTAEEEKFTAFPKPNTLTIVYRDPKLLSFVKYVTKSHPCPRYDYDLQFKPKVA